MALSRFLCARLVGRRPSEKRFTSDARLGEPRTEALPRVWPAGAAGPGSAPTALREHHARGRSLFSRGAQGQTRGRFEREERRSKSHLKIAESFPSPSARAAADTDVPRRYDAAPPMRFGLDFGTSNTSLAVNDGASTRVLPLDPVAGEAMPTVLYVRREGDALVGRPAIEAYLTDNRSRGPLRREFQMLGIRMASSDREQPTVEAHIYTDTHAPGRLFQALKTFLGEPLETKTNVFGTARGLEELIALILAHVRQRAKELTGIAPEAITLGRPVRFIGGEGAEGRATARLRAAAELAGFPAIRLLPP